jgi:hypothetical protein
MITNESSSKIRQTAQLNLKCPLCGQAKIEDFQLCGPCWKTHHPEGSDFSTAVVAFFKQARASGAKKIQLNHPEWIRGLIADTLPKAKQLETELHQKVVDLQTETQRATKQWADEEQAAINTITVESSRRTLEKSLRKGFDETYHQKWADAGGNELYGQWKQAEIWVYLIEHYDEISRGAKQRHFDKIKALEEPKPPVVGEQFAIAVVVETTKAKKPTRKERAAARQAKAATVEVVAKAVA